MFLIYITVLGFTLLVVVRIFMFGDEVFKINICYSIYYSDLLFALNIF